MSNQEPSTVEPEPGASTDSPPPAGSSLDQPWVVIAGAVAAMVAGWLFAYGATTVAWYGWSVVEGDQLASPETNLQTFRATPIYFILGSAAMHGASLTLIWKMLKHSRPEARSILGELWINRPRASLLLWILVIAGSFGAMGLGGILTYVLTVAGVIPPDAPLHDEDMASLSSIGVVARIVVVCLLSIGAGVGEEVLCRGFLLKGLLNRWPAWLAIVASSALFGLAHLDVSFMAATFLIGAWFAYIAWRTRSITIIMVAHVLLDVFGITLHTLPKEWNENAAFGWGMWGVMLVGVVCILPAIILVERTKKKKARAIGTGLEVNA